MVKEVKDLEFLDLKVKEENKKMPTPSKGESQKDFVSRCIPIVLGEKTAKDQKQASAICFSMFRESKKTKENSFHRTLCLKGLKHKEGADDWTYTGLVATTHPDNLGDILSKDSLHQIADYINNTSEVSSGRGAYRALSLAHDWIRQGDPTLDWAGTVSPTARVISLSEGHWGTEVDFEINQFYKGTDPETGDVVTPEEIKYRVDKEFYGGLSIEWDTKEEFTTPVEMDGTTYRFIQKLTEYAGQGLARSRVTGNSHTIIYKEIEKKLKEVTQMPKENKETDEKIKALEVKEKELAEKEASLKKKEEEIAKEEEKKPEEGKEEGRGKEGLVAVPSVKVELIKPSTLVSALVRTASK